MIAGRVRDNFELAISSEKFDLFEVTSLQSPKIDDLVDFLANSFKSKRLDVAFSANRFDGAKLATGSRAPRKSTTPERS